MTAHDATRQHPNTNAAQTEGRELRVFTLGPFATNCYLIMRQDRPNQSLLIDASFDADKIVNFMLEKHLQPSALILTHAHADHIAGVAAVRSAFPTVPIWIHRAESEWLSSPVLNLSEFSGQPITAPLADHLLTGGETLDLLGEQWQVIHTPGHSPGGITLYNEHAGEAFVGDALFAGSIGRTDFPGSDHQTLVDSIRSRLYTLPERVRIYPGHGPASTIAREKLSNPFVRA